MNLDNLFTTHLETSITGRYVNIDHIFPILEKHNLDANLEKVGFSVLKAPIFKYTIGKGPIKVLIWSQMHGNESTTTKALLDLINFLNSKSEYATDLIENFTFCCLPMLNPDGANVYTRENANKIDLNRDFQAFSQPESRVLKQVFDDFKPHYCYNMHDQRTIYGAGRSNYPATLSFLAPSFNQKCDFNSTRTEACRVINAMNLALQNYIPNQIGRFDDSFNNNCCGDFFQESGVPTILFEAGHYQDDYERETVRKFVFFALITSFEAIIKPNAYDNIIDNYLKIPQNVVNFYDIIIKNCNISYESLIKKTNFAIQFTEKLEKNTIVFSAEIDSVGELLNFFGHRVIDADNQEDTNEIKDSNFLKFTIVNNILIKNKLLNDIKLL